MSCDIKHRRKRVWIVGAVFLLSFLGFYFSVPWLVGTDKSVVADPDQSVSEPWLGLPMRDERLIADVRGRLVQPGNLSTPYNLSKPGQTFFAQFGQDKMVAELFNNKTGGFFLEAGALDGEYLSNTLFLERSLGWTGILVEPNPKNFEKLKSKNRKSYLLNAGFSLSDSATRLALHLGGVYPELSTLEVEKKSWTASQVAQVDCFPLFTVLAAAGHPLLDLMVLDVEAVEFKVLRSVPWAEVRVRLLLVETVHVPEGLQELDRLLNKHGFIKYRRVEVDVLYYHPDYFPHSIINQTVNRRT